MPKSFRSSVIIVLALSIAFTVFFFAIKHVAPLARVNPFAEDPFDAVGGFGVQLALFTALLGILRVFVPHMAKEISASQKVFIIRGCTVSVQSVAVTLAAYVVAMIRYPSLWIFSQDGRVLAFLVAGMTILAAVAAWRIDLLSYNAGLSSDFPARRMALINCLVGVLILGIYPAEWRQGTLGGVITAILGVVLLLLLTWSLAAALSPRIDVKVEDFLDELADLGVWLRNRGSFLASILKGVGKVFAGHASSPVVQSLNPRKHAVRFAIVVSIVAGLFMALFKAISEQLFSEPGRLAIVAVIFIVIEGLGVLIGHFLFTRYLGIFRIEK
jgi:hypothetical protein